MYHKQLQHEEDLSKISRTFFTVLICVLVYGHRRFNFHHEFEIIISFLALEL